MVWRADKQNKAVSQYFSWHCGYRFGNKLPTTQHVLARAVVSLSVLTDTVITEAAVGGPGWAEYLAGEAVLELHHLPTDHHLLGARRGTVLAGRTSGGNICKWINEWMDEWMSQWVSEWMFKPWYFTVRLYMSNEWRSDWMNEWANDEMNQ